MTEAQTLRTVGFQAALSVRGRSVKVEPSGPTFSALIEPAVPEAAESRVEEDAVASSVVVILRADVGAAVIERGTSFSDVETGKFLRVTKAERALASVVNRYTCEESDPEPDPDPPA